MTIILNFFYFLPLNISLINIHHILINKSNKYQKNLININCTTKKRCFTSISDYIIVLQMYIRSNHLFVGK